MITTGIVLEVGGLGDWALRWLMQLGASFFAIFAQDFVLDLSDREELLASDCVEEQNKA